jgi:hypothetical protein
MLIPAPNAYSKPHYGEPIAAARSGEADAEVRLLATFRDPDVLAIVKATVVSRLADRIDVQRPALQRAAFDADLLVRLAAVEGLSPIPEMPRLRLLPTQHRAHQSGGDISQTAFITSKYTFARTATCRTPPGHATTGAQRTRAYRQSAGCSARRRSRRTTVSPSR